jgi:hypothetical protein
MSLLRTALLFSLLTALLYSQATAAGTVYTLNGQTYTYVYGSGSTSDDHLGDRSQATASTYVPDATYVPPTLAPHPDAIDCPYNQVYDNFLCKCVCIHGYYFRSSTCVPYPNYGPTCLRNEIYKDSRCVCAAGFFLITNRCDVCPPYSTYDLSTQSCYCISGYQLLEAECRLIYLPPAVPTIPAAPKCSINQELVNNICVCLKDFYLIKGVCSYCVAPNFYAPSLGACRPTCTANQVLDLNTLKCICIGGFNDIDGKCETCAAYSVYNARSKSCKCVNGYYLASGRCIPRTRVPTAPTTLPVAPRPCADVNAFYIAPNCVCKSTYNLMNGICVQCEAGQFYDPSLSICRIPCKAN